MPHIFLSFFFNDTATTEIYTLSLHDALPISCSPVGVAQPQLERPRLAPTCKLVVPAVAQHLHYFLQQSKLVRLAWRSEEHTSELQSQSNLVCRLLLEKKKKNKIDIINYSSIS